MELGLLYFFAIGGLGVIGLMMAGLSSYNKYSLLGGLRAAAAVISYELPLILGVVGIVMLAGTLNLGTIVEKQSGSFLDWYIWQQPLAFLIFFIAATAEGSRTPFDLTEADSEIVAGFATEYSGMRFGFFFFAEYVNVFILSALTVTLFLGGWNGPFDIDPRCCPRLACELRRSRWLSTPGALGPWLLALPLLVPPVALVAAASRPWSGCSTPRGASSSHCIIGFVLVERASPAVRSHAVGPVQLRISHGPRLVHGSRRSRWWPSSCSCAPRCLACASTSSWASPGNG